jgi:hypothetical protein
MEGETKVEVDLPLRVVSFPAPDLPGIWIAHALDLDIMAQGVSAENAGAVLRDAIMEMIAFRLTKGLTPIEWVPAPDEFWKAAEDASGHPLDRAPPDARFALSETGRSTNSRTTLIVAERAPALAHAC